MRLATIPPMPLRPMVDWTREILLMKLPSPKVSLLVSLSIAELELSASSLSRSSLSFRVKFSRGIRFRRLKKLKNIYGTLSSH